MTNWRWLSRTQRAYNITLWSIELGTTVRSIAAKLGWRRRLIAWCRISWRKTILLQLKGVFGTESCQWGSHVWASINGANYHGPCVLDFYPVAELARSNLAQSSESAIPPGNCFSLSPSDPQNRGGLVFQMQIKKKTIIIWSTISICHRWSILLCYLV